jgi:hypothetical protein
MCSSSPQGRRSASLAGAAVPRRCPGPCSVLSRARRRQGTCSQGRIEVQGVLHKRGGLMFKGGKVLRSYVINAGG